MSSSRTPFSALGWMKANSQSRKGRAPPMKGYPSSFNSSMDSRVLSTLKLISMTPSPFFSMYLATSPSGEVDSISSKPTSPSQYRATRIFSGSSTYGSSGWGLPRTGSTSCGPHPDPSPLYRYGQSCLRSCLHHLEGNLGQGDADGLIRAQFPALIAVFADELRYHRPSVLHPDGQVRTDLHTERFTISSAHRALVVVYLCSHRITSYPSRYSRRTQEPSPRGMAFCVSILRFLLVNSATSSTMVSRK